MITGLWSPSKNTMQAHSSLLRIVVAIQFITLIFFASSLFFFSFIFANQAMYDGEATSEMFAHRKLLQLTPQATVPQNQTYNDREVLYAENCPWPDNDKPRKSRLVAFLLAIFFGTYGADRFYLGYITLYVVNAIYANCARGFLKMFTLGGFGIWSITDWALIVVGDLPEWNLCPLKNDLGL